VPDDAKVFVDQFVKFAGGSRRAIPEAVDLCMAEHRTNQQSLMRFCVAFIEAMAEQKTDLRNECSVQLAQKFVQATTARDRALPYI